MYTYHGYLGNALVGSEAQGGGGGGEGVVLLGGQIVRQRLRLTAVHPVGDLVGAREIIGSGDDFAQPNLGGQSIAPVEVVQPDVGAVGDAGEGVVHGLARHGLGGSGLGDGHAGGHALVRHLEADDLALMLQVRRQDGIAHAIIGGRFRLPDGVAAQGELSGNSKAAAVTLDG